MLNNVFCYPNGSRKAITFTIDDGNVRLDSKFMSYVKPAGICGTFNLCTPLTGFATKEEYREFYKGYGIANHCRYHAYPFTTDRPVVLRDEKFDAATADKAYGYKTDEAGLYRIHTYAWTYLAEDDKYMECVDSCQKELEEIFGKGSIRGYIWPCGEQKNEEVYRRLVAYGFQSIRGTGCVEDSTGFAFPADRTKWSYNANYTDMTETGAKYDACPDDGELKFYCFGVHSHDFENAGRWDVLEDFCAKYGNRPMDFYSASVAELFDYQDACEKAELRDGVLTNRSDIDIYVRKNGKAVCVSPGESIRLG